MPGINSCGEVNDISIVVPMYNAAECVDELYVRLCAALGDSFQLIFVNDCSTDDTLARIRAIAYRDPRVFHVNLTQNCGQQDATLCGLSLANGRLAATIDADLQYPPELLPAMIAKLDSDSLDIVYAAPKGGRLAIGTKMRDLLFLLLFPQSRGVSLSSYRVMRFELVTRVLGERRGFNYFSAIVFSSPVRAGSVTFPYQKRRTGKSSYNFCKRFMLFVNIFMHYSVFSRFIHRKPPLEFPREK